MKTAKPLSFLLVILLMLTASYGCAGNSAPPSSSTVPASSAAPAPSEQPGDAPSATGAGYEEGTSPSDDIVNTAAADKVILAVSFGTSFNQARDLNIGGIEAAMKAAYPEYQIRRAFTSQIIIDKLAERENLNIDNIEQAMGRLVLDRVKEVVIQPTTVMAGYEYDDVIAAITPYADKFESFRVGKPLLYDEPDYDEVADIVAAELAEFEEDGTTVLLMGHGTHHEANATYPKIEEILKSKGHDDILVGTVEGGVLIGDLQARLKETDTKKAIIRPFMIVAGDHANNDMAGDDDDSWKTILTNDGYTVETVIEGLGQIKGIQDLFVQHVQDALDSKGVTITPPAAAAAGVTADRIKDGVYSIDVDSSSSMFKFTDCRLTVENGVMTANVTLSGQGFGKLYMGTAEAALADTGENFHEFTLNGDRHSFTIPVSALDKELDCAGFSIRREEWYDHTVTFKSANIYADTAQPSQIDVSLIGGTGRVSIESPAALIDDNGAYTARIVWSSPNYIYMIVDGENKIEPANTEGNSTFEIPITLDTDMTVTACTVAMSEPKEVEYTLRFDSSTIK